MVATTSKHFVLVAPQTGAGGDHAERCAEYFYTACFGSLGATGSQCFKHKTLNFYKLAVICVYILNLYETKDIYQLKKTTIIHQFAKIKEWN